jgi:hypothetical protein
MTEDRESGVRCIVTCIIAHDPDQGGAPAFQAFEQWLCETYGGYTRHNVVGGWKHPDTGQVLHEPGTMHLVSFPLDDMWDPRAQDDAAAKIQAIARRAGLCGLALGQGWVHVTSHREIAHHIRCASLARE